MYAALHAPKRVFDIKVLKQGNYEEQTCKDRYVYWICVLLDHFVEDIINLTQAQVFRSLSIKFTTPLYPQTF